MTGDMRRGEIWWIETVGRGRLVLIIQANALMMISPGFLSVPLYDQPPPTRSLIAPSVQGMYADASDVGRFLAARFKECRGMATDEEMENVSVALRAVQELF